MVVFEVGGRSLTEDSFRHVIETEIEKLVNFFGEEYRDKIEEKIYSTNYVIGDRKKISSNRWALIELVKFCEKIGANHVLQLLEKYDEDTRLNFINKFKDWATSTPNVKDDVEYRAFWVSYFETMDFGIYSIESSNHFRDTRAKFNDPEFIENLQKRVDDLGESQFEILKQIASEWEEVKKEYQLLKQEEQEEYAAQLKWYLNSKQIACRQALAQVFGENKLLDIRMDDEIDISQTFIDYITKKPELRSFDDELNYERMFRSLVGEYYGKLKEYETVYEKEIAQVRAILLEKFEKMDKEKDNGLVRGTLSKLQEYLKSQGVKDINGAMDIFMIFMKKTYPVGAYHSLLETENGRLSFIALPENFQYSMTHETLHAIASDESSNNTGFDDHETTTALNEVITEFFALKIDDRKAQISDSKLTCTYSAAFTLVEEFLMQNLDKIKALYLNGDLESFKNFIGEENFEQLCQNLTELLSLARKIPRTTLKIEKMLKNPNSSKNEKLAAVVEKIKANIAAIQSYIAQNEINSSSGMANVPKTDQQSASNQDKELVTI